MDTSEQESGMEGEPLLTEQQIRQVLSNKQTAEWFKQQMDLHHLMNYGDGANSTIRNTRSPTNNLIDQRNELDEDTTHYIPSYQNRNDPTGVLDVDISSLAAPPVAQAQEEEINIASLSVTSDVIANEGGITHDEYQKLQDEMRTMQRKVDELEAQLNQNHNVPVAASSGPKASRSLTTFFTRNLTDKMPEDNFSLMMLSKPGSQSWTLGLLTFLFQMVLSSLICADQIKESKGSSLFNVPFKVDGVVRAGQLLGIAFVLTTQSDTITSIRSLVLFWKGTRWDQVILEAPEEASHPSTTDWVKHIFIPNGLKFIQGIYVMFVTFVLIVQSSNVIELLKDFTALMVISETDNIAFHLAAYGYLGKHLQEKAQFILAMELKNADSSNENTSSSGSCCVDKPFRTRPLILVTLMLGMISGWLGIVVNQVNGTYFEQRFPDCRNSTNHTLFDLAFEYFGDGKCYGGPLNTLGCEFEGGDCIDFNLAFPLCKGENFINVQERVGNGHCDNDLNDILCDGDGGDCCPYESFPKIDKIFTNGQCDGGRANTMVCNYDNGECESFNKKYPECDIENLAKEHGSDGVVLGDGICDSDIYLSEECGFEAGDCEFGIRGGNVKLTGNQTLSDFNFDVMMSLDGSSVVAAVSGEPKVFRFNSITSDWTRVSQRFKGKRVGSKEEFWRSVAMSSDGNRVAIGSPLNNGYGSGGLVKVYDFSPEQNDWLQVGQSINEAVSERDGLGWKIGMIGDGSKLVIVAPGNDEGGSNAGQIRIYEFEMPSLSWTQVGNNITGEESDRIGEKNLHLNSFDGSRVLFSAKSGVDAVARVYKYDSGTLQWSKVGEDIPSPHPGSSSISKDGNRIAISSESTSKEGRGQVQIFDSNNQYNEENQAWTRTGATIYSSSNRSGNGFGHSLVMSLDGSLLAIGSIRPDCFKDDFEYEELCPTGSVELFVFDSLYDNYFRKVLPSGYYPGVDGNVIKERQYDRDTSIFGLQLSMDDDGSYLSISAYDIRKKDGYFKVYNLDQLFYTKCAIPEPDELGNGVCNENLPYNSEDCAWDGGDCEIGTQMPSIVPTTSPMPSARPNKSLSPRPPPMSDFFSVEVMDKSDVPLTPDGLKLSTNDVFSDTIPVLVGDSRTYWAFSFRDNRFAFQIVAFDVDNNIVGQWKREGARYLDEIKIDTVEEKVVFVGQSKRSVSITFEEILSTMAPTISPRPSTSPTKTPPTTQSEYSVVDVKKSSVPTTPENLKITTWPDVSSTTIPVLKWEDETFWAFSFYDNRLAFQIVSFDSNGSIVREWYKPGARYLDVIKIDTVAEEVVFVGQSERTISISFEEILSTMAPTISPRPSSSPTIRRPTILSPYAIVDVAKSSVPTTPEGLKITTLSSSTTIPVLKWNGETFWAFSFNDNRLAFQIVSFDSNGKIVREWYKPGARYLDEIRVDTTAEEIVFVGQSGRSVSISFEEILSTKAPAISPRLSASPTKSIPTIYSVIDVAKSSVPTTPENLKITTWPNVSSSTIPVLKWGRETFWAFSFRDNRLAFQIVSFDSNGSIVREWYKPGARYLDEIRVDTTAEEIVFVGQGESTVILTFIEINTPQR